ncbi:MAG: hypothetical protein ACFFD4_36380 [Candidatus Odinarchaeota archaeon]
MAIGEWHKKATVETESMTETERIVFMIEILGMVGEKLKRILRDKEDTAIIEKGITETLNFYSNTFAKR